MHRPIRVALVGLAPLIRDVVHTLITGESDDVQSVGKPDDQPVDVYLLGVETSDPRASERLLADAPSPYRVIGVSADGREVQLSELRPSTAALGSPSPFELLELIRRGNRHDAGSRDPSFNRGV